MRNSGFRGVVPPRAWWCNTDTPFLPCSVACTCEDTTPYQWIPQISWQSYPTTQLTTQEVSRLHMCGIQNNGVTLWEDSTLAAKRRQTEVLELSWARSLWCMPKVVQSLHLQGTRPRRLCPHYLLLRNDRLLYYPNSKSVLLTSDHSTSSSLGRAFPSTHQKILSID